MAWPQNSRRRTINLGQKSSSSAAVLSWDFPKTGILASMIILITGIVTGTPSTPNALGMANLLTRTRLLANSGLALIDISGIGYHYMFRDMMEHNVDPNPDSDARDAVNSGPYDLSERFPIALNGRDPVGLIMLQNEDTQLRLEVERGADTVLANDFTSVTFLVTPFIDVWTVPDGDKDLPPFEFAHTITEEQQAVSGAGDVTFKWPRGGIYAQVCHGLGLGATGADTWTNALVRVNQNEYLHNGPPGYWSKEFAATRGRVRELGHIPIDFLSKSGLGNYGSAADLLDTRVLTDIETVIAASGAGTLYTVKRQLFPLPKAS